MRELTLALVLFAGLSGILLWLPAAWRAPHEILFALHVALGLGGIVPVFVYLARHIHEASGRKLRAIVIVLLVAFGLVMQLMLHGNVVGVANLWKWLVTAGALLVCAPWTWVFATLVVSAVLVGGMHLAARFDPDFVLQAETFNTVAPVWLWVAWLAIWARRGGSARSDGDASVNRGKRAARFFGGMAALALLFQVRTGIEIVIGAAVYRFGRTIFALHRLVGVAALALLLAHVGRHWLRATPGARPLRALAPVCIAVLLVALPFVLRGGGTDLAGIVLDTREASIAAGNPRGGASAHASAALDHSNWVDAATTCGKAAPCHASPVYTQWESSAHHHSTDSGLFQAALIRARDERGADAVRICAGCHAPLTLLGEADPAQSFPSGAGWRAGVTCSVCHFARDAAHQNGGLLLASTAMAYPNGVLGVLLDIAAPARHSRRYMPDTTRSVRLCESCHRQVLEPPVVDGASRVLQDQSTSWRNGDYGPHGATPLSCQDCHMPRGTERNTYDQAVRDHRMLGANFLAPRARGDAETEARVVAWLEGRGPTAPGEFDPRTERTAYVSNLWAPQGHDIGPGPLFDLSLEPARDPRRCSVQVVARSLRVGHEFPTGPQDLVEGWLSLRIIDGADVVWEDRRELGTVEVDENGRPIEQHRLWTIHRTEELGRIPPNGELRWDASLPLPRQATSSAERLEGALWYTPVRSATLEWARRATPEPGGQQPLQAVALARAERPLAEVARSGGAACTSGID